MKSIKTFENFMENSLDSKEARRIERQHKLERILGEDAETCDMSDWKDYVPVKDEPVKDEPVKESNWSVKHNQKTDTYHAYDLESGTTETSEEQIMEDIRKSFRSRYNPDPYQKPVKNVEEEVSDMSDWKDYEPKSVSAIKNIKNWFSDFFKSKPKVEKPKVESKSFFYNVKMWFYK